MNIGVRAWVCGSLVLALVGYGSSDSQPGVGGSGASAQGGSFGAAGSASGGSGELVGGSESNGGTGGGSGGTAGGPAMFDPISLSVSWTTASLRGDVKKPLTCQELGAESVGVSIRGGSLETTLNWYTSSSAGCDHGVYENIPWTYGPGEYELSVTLYVGSVLDDNRVSLVSEKSALSIPPGVSSVEAPELQLLMTVMPYSWSILKGGEPISCDAAGAQKVELQLADVRENESTTISWSDPCNQSPAEASAERGSWDLLATLKSGETTLATWQSPQKLTFSDESAAIPPPIVFELP